MVATIDFAQTVRRGEAMLVEGNIQIACVTSDTGRAKRLDPTLRAQLEATLVVKEDMA